MAIDMTTTSDVGWDQAAYNLAADFALRPEMYFDSVADVLPHAQAHPGTSVTFRLVNELSAATSALTEDDDITPVDMGDTTVSITFAEYGNAIKTSAKLRGTSYVVPFDPIVANLIGYNAGLSLDTLARTAVAGGTNVKYAGTATARNEVSANENFTGALARFAAAKLRGNNAEPVSDGKYLGFIHPDVSYDLQTDSGASNWFSTYAASGELDPIKRGHIGDFAGVRWVETPRAVLNANAGNGSGSTGNIDVYETYVVAKQALAKGYSYTDGNGPNPRIVPGPITDTLRRFVPLGWHWFGGYSRYRESCIYRIEAASTIGAN